MREKWRKKIKWESLPSPEGWDQAGSTEDGDNCPHSGNILEQNLLLDWMQTAVRVEDQGYVLNLGFKFVL